MQARSALFDLYGDHLRHRGGVAPVAALVRLLAPLGVAAPAVRTAVSRMVRQGWLAPQETPQGPGYALTDRAVRRLDEAAERIYRQQPAQPWTGCWAVAVLEHAPARTVRERVQRAMQYLGYRNLQGDTWVGLRRAHELAAVLAAEGIAATEFDGAHVGDDVALVHRLFRLDELAAAYRSWLAAAQALLARAGADTTDETAFGVRSELVHEWRKFLFRDPGLPRELVPPGWAGNEAAAYFDEQSGRLLPAATRFVDKALGGRDS